MLKINEKFQIREDDDLNYGLYELKEVKNRKSAESHKVWLHIGYFGKVSHALSAALNKYIKQMIGQEEMDCRTLLERLTQLGMDLYCMDVKHGPRIRPIQRKEKSNKSDGGEA